MKGLYVALIAPINDRRKIHVAKTGSKILRSLRLSNFFIKSGKIGVLRKSAMKRITLPFQRQ